MALKEGFGKTMDAILELCFVVSNDFVLCVINFIWNCYWYSIGKVRTYLYVYVDTELFIQCVAYVCLLNLHDSYSGS